ncbi:MAG: hypothetical protein WCJ25_04900 [Candidatus Moraniibacteriota bacterium]
MERNRVSGSVRSEVISRGKRVSVVSFSGDSILYPRYAIDVLGEKPLYLNRIRTVDGLRQPGFSGVSPTRRRPIVIAITVPDLSAIRGLEARFQTFGEDLSAGLSGFRLGISSGKAAYVPLVGAMALGMVSALYLEHSFGAGAKADDQVQYVPIEQPLDARVLGAETTNDADVDIANVLMELSAQDPSKVEFENRIREMVKGYPIEDMVPYIVEQDRTVATYLIAIAKKESGWGVHVPVLDGQDCFNYWGYRGIRLMMGTGGHTCFNSRKDAVETVGKRLHTLIYDNNLSTPEELIVWKCGSTCAGHDPYSVQKWISDVDMYYEKLNVSEETSG